MLLLLLLLLLQKAVLEMEKIKRELSNTGLEWT